MSRRDRYPTSCWLLLALISLTSTAAAQGVAVPRSAGATKSLPLIAKAGQSATTPAELQALLEASDAELEELLLDASEKLGSLSLGTPDAGALLFPVQMPAGERWNVVKATQSWGTRETVDWVIAAINKVHEEFPQDTPPLHVGDISRKRGGLFIPHKNHQNGRDVDLGFYYKEPTRWYQKAYRSNLDVARTWALVRAIVTETDVELIYCDRFVIALLQEHARAHGEDAAWLHRLFREPSPTFSRPLIRHEEGHRTHMHVRFFNPKAQRLGRRLYHLLEKHRLIRHPVVFTDHLVKAGETLKSVARRYRTTQSGIRMFNELRADALIPGRTYKVPHEGRIEYSDEPIVIPPRLLPPAKTATTTP